jgi:hypothetical protein
MDVGGRECREHILEVELRRDAYRDVGGRVMQEQLPSSNRESSLDTY